MCTLFSGWQISFWTHCFMEQIPWSFLTIIYRKHYFTIVVVACQWQKLCVCVCERERERERGHKSTYLFLLYCIIWNSLILKGIVMQIYNQDIQRWFSQFQGKGFFIMLEFKKNHNVQSFFSQFSILSNTVNKKLSCSHAMEYAIFLLSLGSYSKKK
jgi:hypothetical protein